MDETSEPVDVQRRQLELLEAILTELRTVNEQLCKVIRSGSSSAPVDSWVEVRE